jgi:hypothetical protein
MALSWLRNLGVDMKGVRSYNRNTSTTRISWPELKEMGLDSAILRGGQGRAGISQGQVLSEHVKQVATRMDSDAECEPQAKQTS